MKKDAVIWLLAIALIISLGVLFFGSDSRDEKKYPLLAKRLFVQNPNDLIINFSPLRTELRNYIAEKNRKIAVYFEYLPTGVSINTNPSDEFYRASLVKLPGIMRTYKLIEEGKLREDDLLEVKDYHLNAFFSPNDGLKVGDKKTVAELAGLALRDSNNTAYEVLFEKVNGGILQKAKDDEQTIADVYDFLDIPRPDNERSLFISPKSYASILKSLYFSAYLSYESSSKILANLSDSSFDDWLRKPIPTDVEVAHKFGVYDLAEPANYKVHSDCGIVYVPKRPYLLCVMVQHHADDKIGESIGDISSRVYKYLIEQ